MRTKSLASLCSLVTAAAFGIFLSGCVTPKPTPEAQPPAATKPSPEAKASLVPDRFDSLPGWREDQIGEAWPAFLQSCGVLKSRAEWVRACEQAVTVDPADSAGVRRFFESQFVPHRLLNADRGDMGLVTGYYEPLIRGSRTRSPRYRFPVYGVPDDLLVVDLGEVQPQLKGLRLRGRLDGRRVVPYYSRAEINDGAAPLAGREILWAEDAVDLFFLQIQGSGRVKLENGEIVRIGYADQNGHPYRAIGRLLVERGELTLEQASLQGIRAWARSHPEKLPEVLNYNASYVFFRELPAGDGGPIGSLGVPLSAGRSIAVDPRAVPLGAPVFLATTWPNTTRPLARLMMAQDTGGAIKGGVRADFFWGFGEAAGREAGRMRQPGRMWVLLPIGSAPP